MCALDQGPQPRAFGAGRTLIRHPSRWPFLGNSSSRQSFLALNFSSSHWSSGPIMQTSFSNDYTSHIGKLDRFAPHSPRLSTKGKKFLQILLGRTACCLPSCSFPAEAATFRSELFLVKNRRGDEIPPDHVEEPRSTEPPRFPEFLEGPLRPRKTARGRAVTYFRLRPPRSASRCPSASSDSDSR